MFRVIEDLRDYFDADTVSILESRLNGYLNEAETFIIEENISTKIGEMSTHYFIQRHFII